MSRATLNITIWAISLRLRKSYGGRHNLRESVALFRQALQPIPDGYRPVIAAWFTALPSSRLSIGT